MTKYQLAKLISISGGLKSRKRVQKIVCLLQAAGMSFNIDFKLHHYGPYSAELAAMLDVATHADILKEEEQENSVGTQYNYTLSPAADLALSELEQDPDGPIRDQLREFTKFQKKIDEVIGADKLWLLELGSTIAHYYCDVNDWQQATTLACNFKNVSPEAKSSKAALELATKVVS